LDLNAKMQMTTVVIWSKSKPDVEFHGGRLDEFHGMSSQSHVSHCRVLPLGEFTVMTQEPHATLQGAVREAYTALVEVQRLCSSAYRALQICLIMIMIMIHIECAQRCRVYLFVINYQLFLFIFSMFIAFPCHAYVIFRH